MGAFLAILGIVATVAGIILLIKPMPKLGIPTRGKAGLLVLGGFVIMGVAGGLMPDKKTEATTAADPAPQQQLVSEISKADYEKLCADVPEGIFEQRCAGKRIVWEMFITSVDDPDEAEMSTAPVDGRLFDITFADDVAWQGALEQYEGMKVQMTGLLDSQSGYAHDVREAGVVAWDVAYTEAENAAVEQAKAEQEEQLALADAQTTCRTELTNNVKYPSKMDCPFLDSMGGAARQKDGAIYVRGSCDLMNDFGAMVPHVYECLVKEGAVTMINVNAGG